MEVASCNQTFLGARQPACRFVVRRYITGLGSTPPSSSKGVPRLAFPGPPLPGGIKEQQRNHGEYTLLPNEGVS